MNVAPSSVPGILILGQESPEFDRALPAILGRAPRSLLQAALPFSVILTNASTRGVALIGVRFDMTAARGQPCSVVHYADTLRNPARAEFQPGTSRFICAEPAYTSLVLRGDDAAQTRARMNLENLRRMIHVRASLDCIAFDDGEFAGPDSRGAFERLAAERQAESEFLSELLAMEADPPEQIQTWLSRTAETSDQRVLRVAARKLMSGLNSADSDQSRNSDGLMNEIRAYRQRVALWRSS